MKKSLVLAMAMALGVTASAYAANPFSDVPAGHWAYDSISTLVDAGVVEGYPDGTFGGDKLMTRYEMAQIVAKAMAKGANVDRLAAEFADELDALGVRVAALEKKTDNVKITGEARYAYSHNHVGGESSTSSTLRSRLWFAGQVNDDWTYTAMVENEKEFQGDDSTKNSDESTTDFQRAYLEGKLGGVNVAAGRQDFVIADGNIFDGQWDGIYASYGDKVKLNGWYGRPTNGGDLLGAYSYDKFWGVEAVAEAGALELSVGFTEFDDPTDKTIDENGIFYASANYGFNDDLSLGLVYLHSDMDAYDRANGQDDSKNGYVATLAYKGADESEVGSWGVVGKYYRQGFGTNVLHTMDGESFAGEGFKGWSLGADYTLAENILARVTYYDTKSLSKDTDAHVVFSELYFTF